MNRLTEALMRDGKADDCPIIDMHGHWGPFAAIHMPAIQTETASKLLERSGIRLLVFCHHSALLCPDIGNHANIDAVRDCPDRFRAYCGLNPNYPEVIRNDVDTYSQYPDVYVGFKMLSDYHKIAIDDDAYKPAWEYADSHRLPVLLHTWNGSVFCTAELIAWAAETYPSAKILMGHSLHEDWESAGRLARDYPNVYAELTAVLDSRGGVECLMEMAGSRKVVFGTDFPWFSYPYCIGALIGSGANEDELRDILYRNAQILLKLDE
ncbi:MAG: amidohydrolase family protein [Armatimonadota bacterium]